MLLLLFYFIFFHENYFYFFIFRVPGFIDAPVVHVSATLITDQLPVICNM